MGEGMGGALMGPQGIEFFDERFAHYNSKGIKGWIDKQLFDKVLLK